MLDLSFMCIYVYAGKILYFCDIFHTIDFSPNIPFQAKMKKLGNSHKTPNACKRGGKARGQEQRTGWSYCFYTREAESEKEGELGYKQQGLPCLLTSFNTVPQQKGAATFPNMNTNWVTSVQTWEPKEGNCLFEPSASLFYHSMSVTSSLFLINLHYIHMKYILCRYSVEQQYLE